MSIEKHLVEQTIKTGNLGNKELAATPYHRINNIFLFVKNILKRILFGSLKLAGFEGMNLSETADFVFNFF